MDLANIHQSETSRVSLIHPLDGKALKDDTGTEMFIEVYGAESKAYRKAIFDRSRKTVAKDDPDFDDTAEKAIDLLVDLTVGWHIQLNGENPEFDKGTANWLYTNQPWIRSQVDRHIHERMNFIEEKSEG